MQPMRINIEIDDALMAEALKSAGSQSKKQTVEQALRLLIKLRGQQEVDGVFGNTACAVAPHGVVKDEGPGDRCRVNGRRRDRHRRY
jgi:hypothetical protein